MLWLQNANTSVPITTVVPRKINLHPGRVRGTLTNKTSLFTYKGTEVVVGCNTAYGQVMD